MRPFVLALCALLTACGASTTPLYDGGRGDSSARPDVFEVDRPVPPQDASALETSVADALTAPSCVLRRTDGPTLVHQHGNAGPYRFPSLTFHASRGQFEAFATFLPETDLYPPALELHRFRVDSSGRLVLLTSGQGAVLSGSMNESHALRVGEQLGLCAVGNVPGQLLFGVVQGGAEQLRLATVGAGAQACTGLGVNGARWMLATTAERADRTGTDPWVAVFDAAGAPQGRPYAIPDAPLNGRVAAIGQADGFAGGYVTGDRRLQAGFTLGAQAGRGALVAASNAVTSVAPAAVRWPDDAHLTLVPSSAGGPATAHVFETQPAVAEVARVSLEGFSMSGDTQPAAVATPFGLVVAIAGWGDFDPNNGGLSLTLVTRDFVAHPVADTLSLNRSPSSGSLAGESLAASTDGSNVVLFWAGRERQGAGVRGTFAAVYRCQ